VPGAGLSQRLAIVRGDDDLAGRRRGLRDRAAQLVEAGLAVGGTEHGRVGAVAAREAGQRVEIDALRAHLLERDAAVEELLAEPAPRPLPQASGIDGERVQRDDQRAEPAERRIRLCLVLLGEREVAAEPAGGERLGEQALTVGRGKRDGVAGQGSPVERLHGRSVAFAG
jgi:hypothetical protein